MQQCAACGKALPAADLAQHASESCPKRIVPCLHAGGAPGLACAWHGAHETRASHLAAACPAQEVPCGNADPENERAVCKARVPRRALAAHAAVCPLRRLECDSCGLALAAAAMTSHGPRCAVSVESCGQCGGSYRRALAQMHRCPPREASEHMALHSLRQMARTPLEPRSRALGASAQQLAALLRAETAQLRELCARVEVGGGHAALAAAPREHALARR